MTTLRSAPDRLGIPTPAPFPSRAGMETVRSPLLDFSRAQWCAASPSGGRRMASRCGGSTNKGGKTGFG